MSENGKSVFADKHKLKTLTDKERAERQGHIDFCVMT